MEDERQYYLYRHYRMAPRFRYACAIVADAKTPAGFRITDSDPVVADSGFLAGLDRHFRQTHTAMETKITKDGIYDYVIEVTPGSPRYIGAALDAMQRADFAHNGSSPNND